MGTCMCHVHEPASTDAYADVRTVLRPCPAHRLRRWLPDGTVQYMYMSEASVSVYLCRAMTNDSRQMRDESEAWEHVVHTTRMYYVLGDARESKFA